MNARALVLLVVAGCGGTARRGGGELSSSQPTGAADIPAMRALLDRFSPTGSWIVRTNDTLPREFVFGRSTISLSHTGAFATYFDDDNPDELVGYMSTAVHEVYHAVSSRLAYQLLSEAGSPEPVDSTGVYLGGGGGAPILVRYSPTYPSREMGASYPVDAQTSRYGTYISKASETQSTQAHGVFGLLDEWTAYMHDARVLIDFWPWVRYEAPRTNRLYVRYRGLLNEIWVPYAEFKLFVLHYLLHARTHRPDVYTALVGNESFRRAFAAVDDAWIRVLDDATALGPAIEAIAAERDAAGLRYHRDAAYPAVIKHLESQHYKALLAELRR